MGLRVVQLRPIHGFAAETAAATVIEAASRLGIPVSTTHTIGTAIMGVGSTRRLSAVRWGIAGQIVMAWVFTIPACFLIAWAVRTLLGVLGV
jgi:PiT family inorganic phosphate transporter